MSSEKHQPSGRPVSVGEDRPASPSALRLRQNLKSNASSDVQNNLPNNLNRRRSSFMSDTYSETRKSFRSSTDSLLLPRVQSASPTDQEDEPSHWHSAPLALALLPAAAGLFFKDGSAIVTDVTLLGLAAIFLNWTIRLPWEIYRSAQAKLAEDGPPETLPVPLSDKIDEEPDEDDSESPSQATAPNPSSHLTAEQLAAQKELRIHELTALLSCFMGPLMGAWLLHAIRSQLSRPSEGLVSNYNLTIFLLVAELRPLSHLIKLIQRRTLFLQRKVGAQSLHDPATGGAQSYSDIANRLEELEAYVADNAPKADSTSPLFAAESADSLLAKASGQASADTRRAVQPELDALNRAMRRYEKRMTISAVQVEARLQDIEGRLQDVVVLAAAAQRNNENQRRNYVFVLTNWLCALFVVPLELAFEIIKFPARFLDFVTKALRKVLRLPKSSQGLRDTKSMPKRALSRPQTTAKRAKTTL